MTTFQLIRPGVWTIVSTDTDFRPVLVDGFVPAWADEADIWEDFNASACLCRRCFLHDDPAGCLA